jgi:hypothetical protein
VSVDAAVRAFDALATEGRLRPRCLVSPRLARRVEAGWQRFRGQFDALRLLLVRTEASDDKVAVFYEAAAERGGRQASWSGALVLRLRQDRILELLVDDEPWRLQLGNALGLPTDSVGGRWEGDVYNLPFTLQLEQSGAPGAVEGTLESHGGTTRVRGRHRYPWIELEGVDGDLRLCGRWSGWDELVARIVGLPRRLRLVRRARAPVGRGSGIRCLHDLLPERP